LGFTLTRSQFHLWQIQDFPDNLRQTFNSSDYRKHLTTKLHSFHYRYADLAWPLQKAALTLKAG